MDEQIQITGRTCRKVMVDGRTQYNALKWHGRNHLFFECFEHGNQFHCVCQTVEHVPIVFGPQTLLDGQWNCRAHVRKPQK
jgi:hypothetical protein